MSKETQGRKKKKKGKEAELTGQHEIGDPSLKRGKMLWQNLTRAEKLSELLCDFAL